MSSFFSFLTKKKFPGSEASGTLFSGPLTLSRALFYLFFAGLLIIVYVLLIKLNDTLLVTVPARGGSLSEGVIGAPRFLNPILAATETDVALTSLVYAGMMKEYGDGALVPALAQSYNISPDNRTYTFLLRDKLAFHDGSALTSDDVAFTIEKLQDQTLGAADTAFWQTISVSVPDPRTVIVTLPAADDGFLRKMTVGVMSRAQWQGVPSVAFVDPSLNLSPLGAGAFKVTSISKDESGAPKKIILERYRRYALGAPRLDTLEIQIFANEEELLGALKNGSIDFTFGLSGSYLSEDRLSGNITAMAIPTDNTVALSRLSGEPVLASAPLLAALNRYVDKKAIIAKVENGYGIPEGILEGHDSPLSLEETQATLEKLGYTVKEGVLSKGASQIAIGIATVNDPELIAAGRALSQELATLGVFSAVQPFDPGTYQDELRGLVFPFVLSDESTTLPSAYVTGIPLYTTATVAAFRPEVYGIIQNTLHDPKLRYATADQWHRRTDRVYRWLEGKNDTKQ